jgi:hypothetical protein
VKLTHLFESHTKAQLLVALFAELGSEKMSTFMGTFSPDKAEAYIEQAVALVRHPYGSHILNSFSTISTNSDLFFDRLDTINTWRGAGECITLEGFEKILALLPEMRQLNDDVKSIDPIFRRLSLYRDIVAEEEEPHNYDDYQLSIMRAALRNLGIL